MRNPGNPMFKVTMTEDAVFATTSCFCGDPSHKYEKTLVLPVEAAFTLAALISTSLDIMFEMYPESSVVNDETPAN